MEIFPEIVRDACSALPVLARAPTQYHLPTGILDNRHFVTQVVVVFGCGPASSFPHTVYVEIVVGTRRMRYSIRQKALPQTRGQSNLGSCDASVDAI